jgi:vacuolar protein sorting-associated protein 16
VTGCRFWSSGFVAILSNNHLISVSHYHEPRPKLLALPPESSVHSWTLIPPAHTLSRSVEVLLAIEQTIFVVDSSEAEDRLLPNGPFKHVSVSPNGLYVTLYTEDGKVWVITSDFQNKIGEYESKAKTIPKDVQWCGNDSVVLAWEDEVHMIGPKGAVLK